MAFSFRRRKTEAVQEQPAPAEKPKPAVQLQAQKDELTLLRENFESNGVKITERSYESDRSRSADKIGTIVGLFDSGNGMKYKALVKTRDSPAYLEKIKGKNVKIKVHPNTYGGYDYFKADIGRAKVNIPDVREILPSPKYSPTPKSTEDQIRWAELANPKRVDFSSRKQVEDNREELDRNYEAATGVMYSDIILRYNAFVMDGYSTEDSFRMASDHTKTPTRLKELIENPPTPEEFLGHSIEKPKPVEVPVALETPKIDIGEYPIEHTAPVPTPDINIIEKTELPYITPSIPVRQTRPVENPEPAIAPEIYEKPEPVREVKKTVGPEPATFYFYTEAGQSLTDISTKYTGRSGKWTEIREYLKILRKHGLPGSLKDNIVDFTKYGYARSQIKPNMPLPENTIVPIPYHWKLSGRGK